MRRPIPALLAIGSVALLLLGGCAIGEGSSGEAPVAVAHASPTSGAAPLRVTFDGTDSNAKRPTVAVWEFGDDGDPSDVLYCEHVYERSGQFVARLTVTDDLGRSCATDVEIEVANTAPRASLRLSNDAPIVGEAVSFFADGSVDPDGSIARYTWTFGDGATATGVQASHAYDAVDVYVVGLTVEDNFGASAAATHSVSVHVYVPPGGCGSRSADSPEP